MHAQSDSLNGGLLEACRVKCLLLAGVGVGGMGGEVYSGRCSEVRGYDFFLLGWATGSVCSKREGGPLSAVTHRQW